jgi:putative uncharacterized protein orf8
MLFPANLTEFIEEQMTLYQIENNKKNFSKIYKKCQRTLISLGFWDKAELRLVGKSKTKHFEKEVIEKLKKETAAYFLKLSKFDKAKFDKIKEDNWTSLFDDGDEDDYRELDEDYIYNLPVTQGELITAMLTTLFEEKYTIDVALWAEDKSFCNKLYKYDDVVAQTEFINSDEYIIRNKRLSNTRNYVKKKPKTD